MLTSTSTLLMLMIISFSTLRVSSNNSSETKHLHYLSPVYAIAQNSHLLSASSRCQDELRKFKEGVDSRIMWSLKMLDASGEPKPGFIYGNNFWLGLRSQCYDAMNAEPLALHPRLLKRNLLHRKSEDEVTPYPVHYFSAHFLHHSSLQYQFGLMSQLQNRITLGLCLPATCTVAELEGILKKIFEDRDLSVDKLYEMNFKLVYVKDLKVDLQDLVNWRTISVAIIIMSTLVMVFIGSWYDLCQGQPGCKPQKLIDTTDSNGAQQIDTKRYSEKNRLGQIFLCFSIFRSCKSMFDLSSDSNVLAPLHGIRFFSMVWIIMIHTILFGQFYMDNNMIFWRLSTKFIFQVLSNGTYVVDTCFCLGGFLTAFLFFASHRHYQNNTAQFQWGILFRSVIKRVLRFTPSYIIVFGLVEFGSLFLEKTSEFYISVRSPENCPKYWWRNFLYIHTMFSDQEICMTWSWYMSNDIIFFTFSTILLLLSLKNTYLFVGISITTVVMSSVLTGYLAYSVGYTLTLDEVWRTGRLIYLPPWIRIGPYIIGMLTACLLLKVKNELNIKKIYVWFLWIISSACLFLVLFGTYQKRMSIITSALYAAVSRTIWSIGIAWIIVACCTNHGGILTRILSAKIFFPFSKLMYCAYQLNPAIIALVYLTSETPLHLDLLPNAILFLGFFVFTYLCAFVLSILFEIPYSSLMKLYFKQKIE